MFQKAKRLISVLIAILSVSLLSIEPANSQIVTSPLFRFNGSAVNVGQTATLIGELHFIDVNADRVNFKVRHDPNIIHALYIEIDGFDAFGNPDNVNGIFEVEAYRANNAGPTNNQVAQMSLVITTSAETLNGAFTEVSIFDAMLVPDGEILDNAERGINVGSAPILIQLPPQEGCAPTEVRYRVSLSSINVRSSSSVSGVIVRTAVLDEEFQVYSQITIAGSGIWYRVDNPDIPDGLQEWIYSGNVTAVCNGEELIPEETNAAPTPTFGAPGVSVPATATPTPPPPPNGGGGGNPNPPPDNGGGNPPPPPPQPTNTPIPPPPPPTNTPLPLPPADRDGDGVPDSEDACPDQVPEPGDNTTRGCRDTDGDTLADDFDTCPTVWGRLENGCEPQ